MDEFKKEKDILDGQKKIDKVLPRKCDWRDAREVSLMKAAEYKRERKVLLDKIVPTRVCPSCRKRVYLESSWVVKGSIAVCRSCFHSRSKDDVDEMYGGFLGNPIIRFEFSGWKICCLREKAGIGIQSFADKMGWSRKYQYEIERGDVRSLSLETVEKLIKTFESFGVIVIDGS